jgi:photosystem II stability/assembly factor-like uncharacterized protein
MVGDGIGRRGRLGSVVLAAIGLCFVSLVYLHPVTGPAPTVQLQRLILESAQFTEPDSGWLLLRDPFTAMGEIVTTSDAGRHWHVLKLPQRASTEIFGFELIDRNDAVLQLGNGLRLTSDAGATWRQVSLPGGSRLGLGVYFLDSRRGWYLTSANRDGAAVVSALWSTVDGGATWIRLWSVGPLDRGASGIPLEGEKRLIGFVTPEDGWLDVVGIASSHLMATHDGGATWSVVNVGVNAPATAVRLFPSRTVLVTLEVPTGHAVVRSDDGGISWGVPRDVPIVDQGLGIPSEPALLSASTWLVAAGRQLEATLDGGHTWQIRTTNVPANLQLEDLAWLSSSGRGYAVARDRLENPYLVTTADGGIHWSDISAPQLSSRPAAG